MVNPLRSLFRSRGHEDSDQIFTSRRNQVRCDLKPSADETTFFQRHLSVHRHDWQILLARTQRAFTARSALGYGALNELVFCGTLSVLNPFLGLIALISEQSSPETLKLLCDLVGEECGESLPAANVKVRTYEINGGQCAIVELPEPIAIHEPALIGIVTDASMSQMHNAAKDDRPITLAHFAVTKAGDTTGNLEEWKFSSAGVLSDKGPFFVDYEIAVELKADAVLDQIEKIMEEGGWLVRRAMRDMKRRNLSEAKAAFEKALALERAHFSVQADAFIGAAVIRAMSGSDAISLPGVPFEYEIMNRYLCPRCMVPTDNKRLSGSTEYLSRAIVDHWRASCPECRQDRRLRFALPK